MKIKSPSAGVNAGHVALAIPIIQIIQFIQQSPIHYRSLIASHSQLNASIQNVDGNSPALAIFAIRINEALSHLKECSYLSQVIIYKKMIHL